MKFDGEKAAFSVSTAALNTEMTTCDRRGAQVIEKVNVVHVGMNIAPGQTPCKLLKINTWVNVVHVVHVDKTSQ
jgi:hypothetical protein